MSNLVCPSCREHLGVSDVNIEEGIALCRACSRVSRVADCLDAADARDAAELPAPRGCTVEQSGSRTVVCASIASIGGFLGTLFACLFWNSIVSCFVFFAACGLYLNLVGPLPSWVPQVKGSTPLAMSIGMAVFLIPFVLVGLYLAACVPLSLAGCVRVTLDGMDGSTFLGVGSVGRTRRFELGAVTQVRECDAFLQNNQPRRAIELVGPRVKFGAMMREDQRRWMIGMLRVLIAPDARGAGRP